MSAQESRSPNSNVFKFTVETIPLCRNLKAFLNRLYQQYELPVIVSDISYHLIAYGGPEPCPDPYWDVIIRKGAAEPSTIIDGYYKDGYMYRLSSEPGPFVVDWGISKDYLQTTCAVYVGHNLEAISSVLYLDPRLESFALELNAALRSAASIYLAIDAGKNLNAPAPERAFLARLILEDTSAPATLLEQTRSFKNINIHPKYIIIAIQLRKPVIGRLQNLRSGLRTWFPSMLYSNKDDGVYCFFSDVSPNDGIDKIINAIEAEAEGKADYVCGISEMFTDLSQRAQFIEQAKLSLEYGLFCGN